MSSTINMPKLGLTMTEGTVSKWYKEVGESIKAGETVFEVTTDKLTNEVASDVEGVLLARLCEEGQEIPCTEPVAVVGAPDEKYGNDSVASSSVAAESSNEKESTVIVMPKLGLTMTEGTVSKWYKQEGDTVEEGDTIFEVTTDKLTNEVTSDVKGVLLKQLCKEGDEIPCKEGVAIVGEPGGAVSIVKVEFTEDTAQDNVVEPMTKNQVIEKSTGDYILATPAAKKLAQEKGIPLSSVKATGPKGSVVLKDIENSSKIKISPTAAKMAKELEVDISKLAVNGRIMKSDIINSTVSKDLDTVVPVSAKVPKVIKLTGMRKTIAKRMKESWETSPRVTYNTSVDTTAMKDLRNKLSPDLKAQGIKLTFNHIMMKIVAKVLMEMPTVNSSLNGDELTLHPAAHIGLAVAVENGLIVPNIKDCDTKLLSQIAIETEEKITAAKSNKLSMDDMMGATFTISNLGMFGITSFSPIINQPEMAIMGMCAIVDTPVVENGQVVIRPLMNLSLTADHRVIDGANAAKFLQRVKQLTENPYLLLV